MATRNSIQIVGYNGATNVNILVRLLLRCSLPGLLASHVLSFCKSVGVRVILVHLSPGFFGGWWAPKKQVGN